jgi:uncharacterized membrane protein
MKKLLATGLASLMAVTLIISGCSKGGSDDGGGGDNPPPPPPASCTGTPGPLFTAVKTLMQANCQSCHNSGNMNGGKDWSVDCNIVANKTRIKARAVDEGSMPPTGPLPQSEKDKITAWINAGGRLTD